MASSKAIKLIGALTGSSPAARQALAKYQRQLTKEANQKELKRRIASADVHKTNAKKSVNRMLNIFSTLKRELKSKRPFEFNETDNSELDRLSKWFGVRFLKGSYRDQPNDVIIERLDKLESMAFRIQDLLNSPSWIIVDASDAKKLRTNRAGEKKGNSLDNTKGMTIFWIGTTIFLDDNEAQLFRVPKGPFIAIYRFSDDMFATIIHECMHVLEPTGMRNVSHPVQPNPRNNYLEFDGVLFPHPDFEVILKNPHSWGYYAKDLGYEET